MRLIVFFFVLSSNILYSQNNLRDVVYHINSNNLAIVIDTTDLSIVKSSNSVDSLFFDDSNKKELSPNKKYNLYSSKSGLVFEIVDSNLKWHFNLVDCGSYKLMISQYAQFLVYDIEKKLLFFIEGNDGIAMSEFEPPVKIRYIDSIHYLNNQLNPILSVVLNNEIPLCTSFYNYYTDYIIEDLYIDKPRNLSYHNVMSMPLNKFCFFMEGGPHPLSFYRKVKIKRKIDVGSLFWFLSPNYGIVD